MLNLQTQQIGFNDGILAACIDGNRNAQRLLYEHFSAKMFGVCLRYASDYHNAEDILQESFVKVFNNLDKYRGSGSFEGWLKRICINTAIEHCRKAKAWQHTCELEDACASSAEVSANSRLAKDELLKLVQRLPMGYRTIFNLYAIEGYSHKEIAEMLRISEGTSKSQLARARDTLQKMLHRNGISL
jgi:RNA polymerase sigma factor (sigma-70 family)